MTDNLDDAGAVGARIRALRQARGMKQAELAGGHVSIAYVSRIEAGQRRPSPAVLAELARRLDTTAEHLATGVQPEAAERAMLRLRHAELAGRAGDPAGAEAALRELLGDPAGLPAVDVGRARLALARALETQGRYDDAVPVLEQALADGVAPAGEAMIALTRCHRELGDFSRAVEAGELGLARLRELGLADTDEAVQLEVTVAGAYFMRGDVATAARICREASTRADRAGSPVARASAYWNASVIASDQGRTHEAVELATRALAMLGEGDDNRNIARLRAELGLLMLADEGCAPEAAAMVLDRARGDLRSADASRVDLARCDLGLARCRLLAGDLDGAQRLALPARTEMTGAPTAHAQADVVLGRIAAARGDLPAARECYRAAAATLTGVMADRSVAATWYELGDLLDATGDPDGARDAFRSAAAAAGVPTSPDAARLRAAAGRVGERV